MTTSIKVTAHCADNKRVFIERNIGSSGLSHTTVLRDGDTDEVTVYDNVSVTVREVSVDAEADIPSQEGGS